MITRHATVEDLPTVYRFAWRGFRELKDSLTEKPDPDLIWKLVLKSHKQAPAVILEDDGEIIGVWGLMTAYPSWSHDYYMADYMLYILPEHRTLKAIKLMVKAVKDIADKHKITFKQHYVIRGSLKLQIRIFMMMGFKVSAICGDYRGT